MATDGSSSASSGGSDDVKIPITAEDKLTAVFAQMSASIDDKLGKMVEAMNRRASGVDTSFKRMSDSSKQLDRIGDAVEEIDGRFNRLWKTTIGLGGAFALFKAARGTWDWLKGTLADTPIGQAGSAASGQIGKAWDNMIGQLNGRFKPEIDALASGLQYLGDVAVKVVIPDLAAMSQSLADLFFGRLQNAGVNAQTFAENTSNSFGTMARNVITALAVVETSFQNWGQTWQILVTSSAIGLLDIEDGFKRFANKLDSIFNDWIVKPQVAAMDWMQAKWESLFDYVIRGAEEAQRIMRGMDTANPSNILGNWFMGVYNAYAQPPISSNVARKPSYDPRPRKDPAPPFDPNANNGARSILEEQLRKLVKGMGDAIGINLDRLLQKLGLVQFGPLRPGVGAGAAGNNRGGAGGGNSGNLLETGFLRHTGSSQWDPQVQMMRQQLDEAKKLVSASQKHTKLLEDIGRNLLRGGPGVILAPQKI